ncbi:MAG: hypothetical protein WCQ47_05240 [bacterium]
MMHLYISLLIFFLSLCSYGQNSFYYNEDEELREEVKLLHSSYDDKLHDAYIEKLYFFSDLREAAISTSDYYRALFNEYKDYDFFTFKGRPLNYQVNSFILIVPDEYVVFCPKRASFISNSKELMIVIQNGKYDDVRTFFPVQKSMQEIKITDQGLVKKYAVYRLTLEEMKRQ